MKLVFDAKNCFKISWKSKNFVVITSYRHYLIVIFIRFKEDGELKYLEPAKELENQERSTIEISFEDVEKYNQNLATTIIEEYYRVYPYICQAVSNFIKDRSNLKGNKECYVSFVDVATRHKVRELKTEKIGTLLRISGQVIRTHPVHPELVSGTFVCLDCQTVIKNVEQQFKVIIALSLK